MDGMTEYLARVEEELIEGYRQYFFGVRAYLAFVDGSLELCKDRDCLEGSFDGLVRPHIDKLVATIGALARLLR
jgi:hypothetical protein